MSIFVAVVAIVLGGGILLMSPSLWLSHDGNHLGDESSTRNSSWEAITVHYAEEFRKRAVKEDPASSEASAEAANALLPLQGVVILITGATSGIGKELALWTFARGATVIAMGRSTNKLEQLKELADDAALAKTNQEVVVEARLFTIVADFADLQSVANAVKSMKALSKSEDSVFPDHIDIVVCNAGIHQGFDAFWDPYRATKQGYDLTFGGTNYRIWETRGVLYSLF
jgi:short chain dehydrogenase